VTPEEMNKHAKRIAFEVACDAIETAAQDSLWEVVHYDEQVQDLGDDVLRGIEDLAYDYMMDINVSVG